MPWDSNDMRVAPKTAKVRTIITSSILAQMGKNEESIGIYAMKRCRWSGRLIELKIK